MRDYDGYLPEDPNKRENALKQLSKLDKLEQELQQLYRDAVEEQEGDAESMMQIVRAYSEVLGNYIAELGELLELIESSFEREEIKFFLQHRLAKNQQALDSGVGGDDAKAALEIEIHHIQKRLQELS